MKELMTALAAAMAEMPAVKKNAQNTFLKNKYATLDNIIEAAKPVLSKHKLFFIQQVNDNGVETFIYHESGEFISSGCMKIPEETAKGLSLAQSMGVSITYAKRYQLAAMLGISSDDDTDGQIGDNKDLAPAKTPQPQQDDDRAWITDAQVAKAIARIEAGEEGVLDACKKTFKISKANFAKLAAAKPLQTAETIDEPEF